MSEPYIHPSAVVDANVSIGDGTKVWHFSHLMEGARVGAHCVLGQNTFVGRGVRIGDRCKLQNNVSVYEGVTIEDGVFCGPSVVFTNDLTPRALYPKDGEYVPTLVRRGASLGANATIVCGVTIGKHAMIAAGAVVTKDVADHVLVVGVPAAPAGWACECGQPLTLADGRTRCAQCGRNYVLSPEDGGLREAEADPR